jgi:phytoene desaturase
VGTRRVIIVGAGPGGLAASLLLAAAGVDVTIYERAPSVGGRSARLSMDSAQGAFHFDAGPTFFLYPRVIQEILAACGVDFWREVPMTRLDPLYRLSFMREDGGADDLRLYANQARLAREIARFAPNDAQGVTRFMRDSRRKLLAFEPVLARAFNGLAPLTDPAVLAALRYLRPFESVDDALARYFSDPRLRLAFSFQSKYLGMSPFRCPSLFTILSFLEHEHGVWHPTGGCNAVIHALARVAQRLGVKIETGTPVQQLLFTGRRATGVQVNGQVQRADAVVVNGDFAHCMKTLVPDHLRRRWSDKQIERKRYSCSTFMLYLGLEGEIPLDHHSIVLSAKYAENLQEIESGCAPPVAPSLYVQNASRTDPTLAPPGHSALYVLVPVGNQARCVDWTREAPAFRERVLDRLQTMGIENIRGRIRTERMVTPDSWAADFAIHLGATFNLAHTLDQMLWWRPGNRFEDLERVYLVGGGTHPGSGLPVIFEGARITARLLADDLGVRLPVAQPAPSPAPYHPTDHPTAVEANS